MKINDGCLCNRFNGIKYPLENAKKRKRFCAQLISFCCDFFVVVGLLFVSGTIFIRFIWLPLKRDKRRPCFCYIFSFFFFLNSFARQENVIHFSAAALTHKQQSQKQQQQNEAQDVKMMTKVINEFCFWPLNKYDPNKFGSSSIVQTIVIQAIMTTFLSCFFFVSLFYLWARWKEFFTAGFFFIFFLKCWNWRGKWISLWLLSFFFINCIHCDSADSVSILS